MPKKPSEVFTPRNPEVNESMYIDRPRLEESFRRALEGSQHVLLHGESGTGKSWLYKRLLHADGAAMLVANLANASRHGSICKEIQAAVFDLLNPTKQGYSETKAAKASAFGFLDANVSHTDNYTQPQKDPLESCYEAMRKRAGSKTCCLVLDNLEALFNEKNLMTELGDIIILLDDPRYARFTIKLVIVGTPNGVREYFSRVENRTTVTNRIAEVPEVASLDVDQTERLVKTGFLTELGYKCADETMAVLVDYCYRITDGIPQFVHEFCLELALIAESKEKRIEVDQFDLAAVAWLQSSLTSSYAAIESMMNDRNTVTGRRNQVLFALGLVEKDEFSYSDIEEIVRSRFSESTADKTLNISGILTDLADRGDSLIKRTPKANGYRFVDPKYRMCLRVMLTNASGKVGKLEIRKLPHLK